MRSSGDRHFFPLTSLQIGDLQSYLSALTIFLSPESKKFFILVDNRPWLIDQDKRPAYLWQLMVTKSRLSPFANTRARKERETIGRKLDFVNSPQSNPIKLKRLRRWFTLIDAATCQKGVLLPMKKLKDSILLNKELHHILYGFIVFEVAWAHVRGINYLNELQTDTSMALEVKSMKRWEFDSIGQASSCLSLWFSGTSHEQSILREYLDGFVNIDVFYDALKDFSSSSNCAGEHEHEHEHDVECENLEDKICYCSCRVFSGGSSMEKTTSFLFTPPACGPYKKRKIMKKGTEIDEKTLVYGEVVCSHMLSVSPQSTDHDNMGLSLEPTIYKNAFVLFKFNDHDLPFKLKDHVMSDLRLLTLLEYGLPSWVIFFQSYPVFCQIYRPWMCPLARALYVIVSIVTVVIGFYDLYKNVPLLKTTASRLFGPFFDWIESWEMISRLNYLGTMLFLHNFEKVVKWFLTATRALRSVFAILTKPIAAPLMEMLEFVSPIWKICFETIDGLSSVVWTLLESSCTVLWSMLEMIISPFRIIFSTISSIATLILCPILWTFWEIFVAPIRLMFAVVSFLGMVCFNIFCLMRDAWSSITVIFQFTPTSQATAVASEASMLRSLWNDLFSQVFRAIRSILYGFVAFFTTCNRHRLSIYNHIQEFVLRFSNARQSKFGTDQKKNIAESHIEGRRQSTTKLTLQPEQKLYRRRYSKTKETD